jgi:hypothetical protein
MSEMKARQRPVSLHEFLKVGRLNDLRLGLTKDQVIELMGQPDMVGGTSRKYNRPSIFKYGNVEVHFARKLPALSDLIYIENYPVGAHTRLPELFVVTEWGLSGAASRHEVIDYLSAYSIEHEMTPQPAGLPPTISIPGSGVGRRRRHSHLDLRCRAVRINACSKSSQVASGGCQEHLAVTRSQHDTTPARNTLVGINGVLGWFQSIRLWRSTRCCRKGEEGVRSLDKFSNAADGTELVPEARYHCKGISRAVQPVQVESRCSRWGYIHR